MGKLFSNEDFQVTDFQSTRDELRPEISDMLKEYHEDMNIAVERFRSNTNAIMLMDNIRDSMESRKLASVEYFATLEAFTPVLRNLADNLGVSYHVPSLEDFKNPFGTEASHSIATEGFFDYVKKLWDEVMDLIRAFFKKMSIFLSRLFKLDLDLETYEKYLETMIVKLKSKKPVMSDQDKKSLISTELPSLLANEGMEKMDVNFLLSTGEYKLKQLVNISNNFFIEGIGDIGIKQFDQLYRHIDSLTKQDLSEVTRDVAVSHMNDIKDAGVAILRSMFANQVSSPRDLPETVYNDLYNNFDRSESDDTVILSLVNNSNSYEALPKNFNLFTIISNSSKKVFVTSSTETNTHVENKLNPISNVNSVVTFYEYYKKFKKEVDVKRIGKSLDELDEKLEKIINVMRTRFVDMIENIAKNKTSGNQKNGDDVEANVRALVDYLRDIALVQVERAPITEQARMMSERRDLVDEILNRTGLDNSIMDPITNDGGTEEDVLFFIEAAKHIPNFVKNLNSVIQFKTSSSSSADPEEVKEIVEAYKELQRFLLNYINNIQAMLRDTAINLPGTCNQLRYELVRYIYNSVKLFPTM